MPATNQRIGEYVLTRQIGQGAFGEVWLASHHAWSQELAAVKIPTDPQFIRNLQQEGLAVRGLNHPNIVRAINFDPWAEVPYLVMEYVPGQSLRSLIQQGPLQPEDAVAVMRQVLAALDHAHRAGLVHRDVKPENILIHERSRTKGLGGKGVVKLTDFGMGKAPARPSGSILISQEADRPEKIGGTQHYIAPEQFDGAPPDARSDLYACGVVLFEMLTGKRPVGTELPSEINASVPVHLNDAYRNAVARHERRFTSAAQMFAALEPPAADGSQPSPEMSSAAIVELGRAAASVAGHRSLRKRPLLGVVPALVAALLLIGVAAWIWLANQHNADTTDSQNPPVNVAVNATPVPVVPAKPDIVPPPELPEAKVRHQQEQQLQALKDLFLAERLTAEQYQLGQVLFKATPGELDEYDAARRAQFAAVLEGRLSPDKLAATLAAIETPEQKTAHLAREEADRKEAMRRDRVASLLAAAKVDDTPDKGAEGLALLDELLKLDPNNPDATGLKMRIQATLAEAERQRQAQLQQQKVPQLLATAKANDSKEKGHDALVALDELLTLDPSNTEALALRNKINAYYPPRKIINSIGMTLIEIKPGEFLMGSPVNGVGHDLNATQHKVTITKPFMLGVYHVTRGQFSIFVKATGYQTDAEKNGDKRTWANPSIEQTDDHPVVCVSWNDAQAFCQWLSKREGKTYCLPTEAQWEYACRAGTTTRFHTGEGDKDIDEAGWYRDNSGGKTHPVGQKKPNAWGLYDMHGNAWNWCKDYYGPYPDADVVDPTGPAQGDPKSSRVLRGGSWGLIPRSAASRNNNSQDYRDRYDGFRCVLDFSSQLLAFAKANDSQERGHDALTALDELLEFDPGNAEALALRNKINAYYPARKITNSIGMTLIEIKPGEFLMGSPVNEEGRNDDETQHKVKITKPFMLGITAVTQKQWATLMGSNPSRFKGDDLPVEEVSWDDAEEFCRKLIAKEGKKYRLPTEAEWEYACRAGTTTQYNTGDGEKALDIAGWYKGNSGDKTHPVGQKKANAWSLYDMHGNGWEWCNDYLAPYPAGDAVDPTGPTQGDTNSDHVLRGAAYNSFFRECRAACRNSRPPDCRRIFIGFRCVLELP